MIFKNLVPLFFLIVLGGCATKTSIVYGDIYRSNSVPEGYVTIGFHGKLYPLDGWDVSEDRYLVADILSPDNFVSISNDKKFLGIGSWIERCDKSGDDHFSGPIIMTFSGSPEILGEKFLYKAIFVEGLRDNINSSYKSNLSDLPASKLNIDTHCLFIGASQYFGPSRLVSNPLPIDILE